MNYIVAVIPNLRNARGAQPRARGIGERDVAAVAANTFGFESKDIPKHYYTDENEAVAAAKKLASAHPQVQYGVFAAGRIFETATPTVLEKGYNTDGELTVKKEKA